MRGLQIAGVRRRLLALQPALEFEPALRIKDSPVNGTSATVFRLMSDS
jgi:hypothetical protein